MSQMEEATPEGFLTVSEAYQVYQEHLGTGETDGDMGAFLTAFRDGRLLARARFQDRDGWFDVPKTLWGSVFFPERVFLEPVAAETWAQFHGSTFMVSSKELGDWIASVERAFDPMLEEFWTLPMASAWVAFSEVKHVRTHWDKYLSSTGRPTANLLETEGLMSACEFLRKRWETGSLQLLAEDAEGAVVVVEPHELSGLQLTFDDSYLDEWRRGSLLGPVAYRRARMPRPHLKHLPSARRKPVPSVVSFDGDETTLTLYEASLWVGMKGNGGEVPEGALEEGAASLFGLLAATPGLDGTGIDLATYLPCTIPKPYWVMATTSPLDRGHFVSFIDTEFQEIGGMLTPKGDRVPKWGKITVPGEALRAAAPHVPRGENLPDWVDLYLPPEGAGRPSSEELILKALRSRAADGNLEDTLSNEAHWLSLFVTRCAIRGWPAAAPATVEKMIRQEYRRLTDPRTK